MPFTLADIANPARRRVAIRTIVRAVDLGRLRHEVEDAGGEPGMTTRELRPYVAALAIDLDELVDFEALALLPGTQIDDIMGAIFEALDGPVFEIALARRYRKAIRKGIEAAPGESALPERGSRPRPARLHHVGMTPDTPSPIVPFADEDAP